MDDRTIGKTILFLALMFFLPLLMKDKPPEIKEIFIEPETVNVEVHIEKRTVVEHKIETETIEEEVVEEEKEIVEEVRPVPVIAEVPEPETNGNMVKMRCTCYLWTGNRCADGVWPYHGALASNREHLGQGCKLYKQDGTLIGEFVSHDVGGHPDLMNGSAVDIYRNTIEEAWDWLYENAWVEGGQWFVWLEWEERE